MTVLSLGPLVFGGERLAAMIAGLFFLILCLWPAQRVDERFSDWSIWALIGALLAGRAFHVAANAAAFMDEPWRILMVHQGGFSPLGAVIGAGVVALAMLRKPRMLVWAGSTIAATWLVWTVAAQIVTATGGIAAPTGQFTHLGSDRPFALVDAGERPIVLNLWATWCPPCRRELPMMAEMARQRSDVAFVFASQGESAEHVRDFLAREGIDLEYAIIDRTAEMSQHYGARGYPATLFLSADGRLRHVHFGEISREILAARLAEKAGL